MDAIFSRYWLLIAGVWYAANGILHDIFVLKNHRGIYSRELLRLLMDGHVLLLSGVLMIVSFFMVQNTPFYAAIIGAVTAIFMLIYCAMIFPFLKSVVTMVVTTLMLLVCIRMLVR